jgi:O-antigen ligase
VTGEARTVSRIPAPLIGGFAILAAIAAGRFLAHGRMALGAAIVLAVAYILLAFLDLATAIAAWVALLFIVHLSGLGKAPTAIEILLLLAWLGTAGIRRGRLPVLRAHTWLPLAVMFFACWLTFSIAWAEAAGKAAIEAGYWWESVLVFLIVATTLATPRDVRFVALAFVIGSVVSVTIGFLGLGDPTNPVTAEAIGDRLVGGGGDPNYQAAAFLGAMFLAGGLISVYRQPGARIALSLALALISAGFFATQSRGGLLALGFALIAAFVLLPRHRARIVGLAVIAGVGLAAWLPSHPKGLDRLTHFGGSGGSGRQDEWTVAWRIFGEHHLSGVGVGNFTFLEPRYVLRPGGLSHVTRIAESPNVVHNAYLQFLAETGVVGLLAFLLVLLASLRACWLAARRFDALGRRDQADLARAILIATIGMAAAMFFISHANDFRLWILFALGPVLLTLAKRWPAEHAAAPDLSRTLPSDTAPWLSPRSTEASAWTASMVELQARRGIRPSVAD